jgi:hypothetical protein
MGLPPTGRFVVLLSTTLFPRNDGECWPPANGQQADHIETRSAFGYVTDNVQDALGERIVGVQAYSGVPPLLIDVKEG